MNIHPQKINGQWRVGYALDIHTISSIPNGGFNAYGGPTYDTVRTEIGELLYRLKYNGNTTVSDSIISAASDFLSQWNPGIDLIVPVPPSGNRSVQPVIILADGVGKTLNIPVIKCISTTRSTTQLKDVNEAQKRKELLEGLYAVDATKTSGKNILLFDDLYRSGSTMNAITDVLYQAGGAGNVYALAITRTRSNQ